METPTSVCPGCKQSCTVTNNADMAGADKNGHCGGASGSGGVPMNLEECGSEPCGEYSGVWSVDGGN